MGCSFIEIRFFARQFGLGLFPALPYIGLIADRGLTSVAHDGFAQYLLVFEHFVEFLVGAEILHERDRVGVFGRRVDECVNAAGGAGNAFELAFAQAFSFRSTNWNFTRRSLK